MVRTPLRLVTPLAALAALALVAGCGEQDTDRFAPPCPVASIPRDFADLQRYRGTGRDLTDLVLEGRVVGLGGGGCARDGSRMVSVKLAVTLELSRGPAATGRNTDVAYFVAVSRGEQILDKQVYRLRPEFASNTDRLRVSGDEIELRLPVTPAQTAAAYTVSVGFELSPAEVAVNRARRR